MPGPVTPLPGARLAVLDAVRSGADTVNAIASALGVTDNAVRLHLAALERDGLLTRRGVRRSGAAGQPAAEYQLTNAGEVALSSAYAPALTALVAALGEQLDARAKRALFLEAGRRLSAEMPSRATGSLAERAHACAALLESLGGRLKVKTARGMATLSSAGCPLAGAVRAEPGTCTLIEALLKHHAGVRVAQRCAHGEHPACKFEVSE